MEQFLHTVEETLNTGDPIVRTWLLIGNNSMPFILCGFYALFSTVIGPALMKNRKPFDLRILMVIFNFSIVVAYITALTTGFWYLPNIPFEEFCKGTRVQAEHPTYTIATCCWWVYILKYVELFDTVFFVLRKKQNLITFLHVLHHTTVPILGWFLLRTERGGLHSLPIILNTFVHIIMYTYYGLAAIGPQVKKYLWWKKYLTQLQMFQFLLMIVFGTIIAPLSGCTVFEAGYLINVFFAPLFLYLFYRFYSTTFEQRSPTENGVAKKKTFTNEDAKRETATDKTLKKVE